MRISEAYIPEKKLQPELHCCILATSAHSRRTRPADLTALIDLVRARRCDHVFAAEDVRLEMLATLEALAIKLTAQDLMGG
jgi:hypothetical protein